MNRVAPTRMPQAQVPPGQARRGPRIGPGDDAFEHEARRAADAVVSATPSERVVSPTLSGLPAAHEAAGAALAPRSVDEVVASPGQALPTGLRRDMERRFGVDFSQVRVHADASAARSAREVQARAWTLGRHIAFGSGRYAPDSAAGRHLVAHELAHVVQQSGGDAARGAPTGQPNAVSATPELRPLHVPPREAEGVLQRELDSSAPPAVDTAAPTDTATPAPAAPVEAVGDAGGTATPTQAPPAAPAVPTLSVSPSATLTRGDTLSASLAFTPRAGETMNVVAWRYATPNHGTVTRATTEPTFQTGWSGPMALTGTLQVDYTVTPAGGAASAVATLTQAVTVNDRSGAPWASTPTLNAENAYAGRPNPPVVFSDLGLHDVNITNPAPTATAVAAGPNTGLSFVGSLTAGTYTSQPHIHPALTNATSTFKTFHQNPSRLYFVAGTTRTLIPLAEYSALSVSTGSPVFTVPSWETFYKAHRVFDVSATGPSGQGPVPLRDAWWGLDANTADAGLVSRDDAAIRAALRVSATSAFSLSAAARGSWEGYELMQAAAILAGTRSHEYQHAVHSHRANFTAMLRALDPQRKIEQTVSSPSNTVTFATKIADWVTEIMKPNHELVDEAASRTAEAFVAVAGAEMAGVNVDPSTGATLGSVWNISGDAEMHN